MMQKNVRIVIMISSMHEFTANYNKMVAYIDP